MFTCTCVYEHTCEYDIVFSVMITMILISGGDDRVAADDDYDDASDDDGYDDDDDDDDDATTMTTMMRIIMVCLYYCLRDMRSCNCVVMATLSCFYGDASVVADSRVSHWCYPPEHGDDSLQGGEQEASNPDH